MSGDHTRFIHDPLKRHSGVLMQQGRVQLDSDWNEFVSIAGRRQILQSLDTFGPYGVPYETTPDAFLVSVIGGAVADLGIEPGRLYVDGHLAELFAAENATYRSQPFYPDPPALPAGDVVVYLDLWEREITFVEDPSLLDVALGGADTTTRTQTVWQVRMEPRPGAVCDLDVGPPPSAGLLSTGAVLPPAPDDPCLLPPLAGYRGVENRLYRVEIHTDGAMGTARFKWSRDNGSIVSAVRGLVVAGAQTTLAVDRIGRDRHLRFRIDDWVTLTDDHRELMGEPGEMARVVDIVETRNEIVLDRAIPTPGGRPFGGTPLDLAARHTRLQRWDQTAATNVIDGDGLIATGAGPIDLEDGVQVRFDLSSAAGAFRTFDYWVFAARVADASVEILNRAAPRGIEHHYVQLAAITGLGGSAPMVMDCRPPPEAAESCCCVSVAVGESIQDAIDKLPREGGCVCLKAGVHRPRDTVVIARPNVKLTGESPGVFVELANGDPVLVIKAAAGIRVEAIVFRGAVESGSGLVTVAGSEDVAFFDCGAENLRPLRVIGIDVVRTDRLRIEASSIRSVEIGVRLQGYCERPVVTRSLISPGGIADRAMPIGILVQSSGSPVTITANTIREAAFAIVINDAFAVGPPLSLAGDSVVLDNTIVPEAFGPAGGQRRIAIDCAADGCRISGNRVILNSGDQVGIRATGSETIVSENVITATVQKGDDGRLPVGIQIGFEGEGGGPTAKVLVADNQISGPLHAVLALFCRDLTIHGNAVAGEQRGNGVLLGRTKNSTVSTNRIAGAAIGLCSLGGRANRLSGNDVSAADAGLLLALEASAVVTMNRIENTAVLGAFGLFLFGRTDFIENRLTFCANQVNLAVSLGVSVVVGELHVEANEVLNTGMNLGFGLQAGRTIGIFGGHVMEARVESNSVDHVDSSQRDREREDRALLLGGLYETIGDAGEGRGFPVQMTSNRFAGTGRTALVQLVETRINANVVQRFDRVLFNQNYCSHVSTRRIDDGRATVVLVGTAAVVMGNQIKAMSPRFPSVNFNDMPGPFIGNITRGDTIRHIDFPAPVGGFNHML